MIMILVSDIIRKVMYRQLPLSDKHAPEPSREHPPPPSPSIEDKQLHFGNWLSAVGKICPRGTSSQQTKIMSTSYRTNWIINDAIGIFLGIAVAAGILTYEGQMLGQPGTAAEKVGSLGVALAGGLIAGTILAWFQYRALKRRYSDLSWTGWWGNTVIAFVAGWILAIAPSFAYTGENAIQQVIPPFGIPVYTAMYGSIIFGGLMGAFIGFAQYLELRKHREKASSWIGMNVFGWALGLFLIVVLGLLFGEQLSVFLLTGVAGGLVAALCIAGITSTFFRKVEGKAAA